MSYDQKLNAHDSGSMLKNKMKTWEEEVKICYLVHNTSRVKKTSWSYGMGIMTNSKQVSYSYEYAQTKQQIN
jgi:hypothetical protein